MHILIAPDSFKGCLSSLEVSRCIDSGFRMVFPGLTSRIIPAADGGEGTVQAVLSAVPGARRRNVTVSGPLGQPVLAEYGLLPDGSAVIETASASGLPLVPPELRNPERTTTRGTGELLRDALDQGCRKILVGIGGSATNDGGAGMARALGARFLDRDGRELPEGGGALARLSVIDLSALDPRLRESEITAASDVTNPLCGVRGASLVYGPQKGASPEAAKRLDTALEQFGAVLRETFGTDYAILPGAGAAGGLGAGLMAFCGASLRPGIEVLFQITHMGKEVGLADLILTGEGRIDATSASGKLLSGIGQLAKEHRKPVIAFAGSVAPPFDQLRLMGLRAAVPIADGPITLERSLEQAASLITRAACRTASLLQAGMEL